MLCDTCDFQGNMKVTHNEDSELKVPEALTVPDQGEQSFPRHFHFHSRPLPISGNPKVLNTKTKSAAAQLSQLAEKYDRDFQIRFSPQ